MTPEQFKALGLKEGDIVRVTLDLRVTDFYAPKGDDGRPFRGLTKNGVIFWPNVGDIRALEVVETTEAPLAVGDCIWHKSSQFGESQEIKAIVDVGGVPHVVFPSFNGGVSRSGLVCGPLADYVRAKA